MNVPPLPPNKYNRGFKTESQGTESQPPANPEEASTSATGGGGRASQLTTRYALGSQLTEATGLQGVSGVGSSPISVEDKKKITAVIDLFTDGTLYQEDPDFAALIDKYREKLANGTLTEEDLESFKNDLEEYKQSHKWAEIRGFDVPGCPNFDINLAMAMLGPGDLDSILGRRILDAMQDADSACAWSRQIDPKAREQLIAFMTKYRQQLQEGTFNMEEFKRDFQNFLNSPDLDPNRKRAFQNICYLQEPFPPHGPSLPPPLNLNYLPRKWGDIGKDFIGSISYSIRQKFSAFDDGQLQKILDKYQQMLTSGHFSREADLKGVYEQLYNELVDYVNSYDEDELFPDEISMMRKLLLNLLPGVTPPFPEPEPGESRQVPPPKQPWEIEMENYRKTGSWPPPW